MTGDQFVEVLNEYEALLQERGFKASEMPSDTLNPRVKQTHEHILWMRSRTKEFVAQGAWDKANRWLGFIQGFMWVNGIYTIADMRAHNRSRTGS